MLAELSREDWASSNSSVSFPTALPCGAHTGFCSAVPVLPGAAAGSVWQQHSLPGVKRSLTTTSVSCNSATAARLLTFETKLLLFSCFA